MNTQPNNLTSPEITIRTMLGEDAIIVNKFDYQELVARNHQLQRINDGLNEDVSSLTREIASLKARDGQGINWNDLKTQMMPAIDNTIAHFESQHDDAHAMGWRSVRLWLDSLR